MKKSEQIFGLLTLFDGFYRYLHLSIHIFGCYMTDDEIEFPQTNTIGTATTISNVYYSVSDITAESKTITITEVIE